MRFWSGLKVLVIIVGTVTTTGLVLFGLWIGYMMVFPPTGEDLKANVEELKRLGPPLKAAEEKERATLAALAGVRLREEEARTQGDAEKLSQAREELRRLITEALVQIQTMKALDAQFYDKFAAVNASAACRPNPVTAAEAKARKATERDIRDQLAASLTREAASLTTGDLATHVALKAETTKREADLASNFAKLGPSFAGCG